MNALLMTLVALLMRTVTVSFNVYVSNLAGAETMGLLALVGGVYGFAVTLATSGIHLATVRTVAERLEQTGGTENVRALRACLSYAAFFGTLATILLFTLAAPLGRWVLKDLRTVRALYMLSFTLLPISLTSVLNGYFTAVRRAWKNALSQVTEQGLKICLTSYLLVVIAPKTTEGALLAILAGGAVSECFSLAFNVLLYALDKRHDPHVKQAKIGTRISVKSIALPVAISAYARSGLLTIEHILIPQGLSRYGTRSSLALAAYGSVQSMALPVILYPAAILSSFASLLIPEITEQQAANNKQEIRYITGRVYQMTLLFSIGVAGIMLFLSGELGKALYDSSEVGHYIRTLAPLIPIMYMDTATDSLLKGLGEQVYSMRVNIADALISVICVAILVPRLGINGYLITIYVTEIFNATLSIARLLRVSGFRPRPFTLLVGPLFSVIAATQLSKALRLDLLLPFVALHIIVCSLFYLLLLFITGTWRQADTRWLLSSFRAKKDAKMKV